MSDHPGPGGGLFGAVLAHGRVAGAVSDRAWLQAILDVEAAIAAAEARAGLLSEGDQPGRARQCRDAGGAACP